MSPWVAQSLAAVAAARTSDEVLTEATRQCGALGLDRAIYLMRDARGVRALSNLPNWWQQEYRRTGRARVDPFLRHCCREDGHRFTGIRFTANYTFLSPNERDFIGTAAEAGLLAGVAVPVAFTGEARVGGWNLGGALTRRELTRLWGASQRDVRTLLFEAHRRIDMLLPPAEPPAGVRLETPAEAPARRQGPQLTSRELDSLALLAAGLQTKQIAQWLDVSYSTVEFHLRNARRKLGARTREQSLALAITRGLLQVG